MSAILACIDGSVYSRSVAEHAAWAARRMKAPVTLLKVLGRREAMGAGAAGALSSGLAARLASPARRQVQEELAALEAERALLLERGARLDLEEARTRVEAAGAQDVDTALIRGDLLDEIAAREADAALLVIGKRGEAADFAQLHLGSNLERIARASARPVLIASSAFRPPQRLLVAYDGRASAERAVDAVARDPLYRGLAVTLAIAGAPDAEQRARLDAACARLEAQGHASQARLVAGEPSAAIAALVEREGVDLLAMGAYGHSRWRSLVLGSTTSELIRACRISIMLYR
ncbi:MAG: universal stress protein [Rubrimonas sp.]|uniref:universal stress protein n=1 Tax=Rubrimonas sp. TaxID=2036015 RepID=UPI002FDEA9DE